MMIDNSVVPPSVSTPRRRRSDAGTIMLSERDLTALRWVAEQYAVRVDQLAVLLGRQAQKATKTPGRLSPATVTDILDRWYRLGYIPKPCKFLAAEPAYVWISAHGLRALNLDYSYVEPAPVTFMHLSQVNAVRLLIEEKMAKNATAWTSERTLRLDQPKTQHGSRRPHLPDAILGTVAIEVELSLKTRSRLVAILRQLARTYHTIWYFVQPSTLVNVKAALKELETDTQKKFVLYDLTGRHIVE